MSTTAQISFFAENTTYGKLELLALNGQSLTLIKEGIWNKGSTQLTWAAALPAGTYILRLQTPGRIFTRKLVKL